MPDADRRLLKIRFATRRDIAKGLGIHVDERKPGALDLHHDAMSLFKGVRDLVDVESDLGRLAGYQWLGFFIAVAELTPEDFRSHEALIASGIRVCLDAVLFAREDVDELYDEIGVGAGRGKPDVRFQPAGDGQRIGERFGLVDEDVGALRGEALVGDDIGVIAAAMDAVDIRYRVGGSLRYSS